MSKPGMEEAVEVRDVCESTCECDTGNRMPATSQKHGGVLKPQCREFFQKTGSGKLTEDLGEVMSR